jgi:4a-hydroxytetrahydrobiopterin dehydratase
MARLTLEEARLRLLGAPGWELAGPTLRRRYAFQAFEAAMAFVNRVAALAEAADHHPDILIEYSKVTLTLTSHDAGGLTERDFTLAHAIDAS